MYMYKCVYISYIPQFSDVREWQRKKKATPLGTLLYNPPPTILPSQPASPPAGKRHRVRQVKRALQCATTTILHRTYPASRVVDLSSARSSDMSD